MSSNRKVNEEFIDHRLILKERLNWFDNKFPMECFEMVDQRILFHESDICKNENENFVLSHSFNFSLVRILHLKLYILKICYISSDKWLVLLSSKSHCSHWKFITFSCSFIHFQFRSFTPCIVKHIKMLTTHFIWQILSKFMSSL